MCDKTRKQENACKDMGNKQPLANMAKAVEVIYCDCQQSLQEQVPFSPASFLGLREHLGACTVVVSLLFCSGVPGHTSGVISNTRTRDIRYMSRR